MSRGNNIRFCGAGHYQAIGGAEEGGCGFRFTAGEKGDDLVAGLGERAAAIISREKASILLEWPSVQAINFMA